MFYIGKKFDDTEVVRLEDGEFQTRELANKAAEKLALETDEKVIVVEVVAAYRRKYTVAQEGPGSSVPPQDPRLRHV